MRNQRMPIFEVRRDGMITLRPATDEEEEEIPEDGIKRLPLDHRLTITRAALVEAGRPDLALVVWPNAAENPTTSPAYAKNWWRELDAHEKRLVRKAMVLGHEADPNGALVYCCMELNESELDAMEEIMDLHRVSVLPRCHDCARYQ